MTRGVLPALEKLSLGHAEFHPTCTVYREKIFYEGVSLLHLAAFCNILSKLWSGQVPVIFGGAYV